MNTAQDRKLVKVEENPSAANFDFEVWAKAVKQQMLAVIQKRR